MTEQSEGCFLSAGQEDEVGMETEKLEYMEVNMAFDFKKEYKEFYMPKNKPEIVTIPKTNYIAMRGNGDPNEKSGAYQQAIGGLYR